MDLFHFFKILEHIEKEQKKHEFLKIWMYHFLLVLTLNRITFQYIHQKYNSFKKSGPTVKVRKDKLSIFIFTHLCFPNLFKNVKILKKLKLIKIPNLFFDVFIFIWIFKSPTLTITNWSSLVLLIPKLLGSKKNTL